MAQRPPHDVLSDCLERWEQGQGGVEEFLAQHPELREELEPLLGLAVELWALPKIKAPDSLRQDPLWRRPPAGGPARRTCSTSAWRRSGTTGARRPTRCWRATRSSATRSSRCWTSPTTWR